MKTLSLSKLANTWILLSGIGCCAAFLATSNGRPNFDSTRLFSAKECSAKVDSDIIIIGGGLVGTALGAALHKRGSNKFRIYEQAQQLRKVGAAIGLYPNGIRALRYISPEICNLVQSKSSPCTLFERRDSNDNVVKVTNVPFIQETAPIMYAWFQLQQHFIEALPNQGECLNLGYSFVSYKVLKTGIVQVLLRENSTGETMTRTCRLLIGADGIHSQVRQQLTGTKPLLNYYDKVMYRAVLEKDQVDDIVAVATGTQISWQGDQVGKSFSVRETTDRISTITAAALADLNSVNDAPTKKERLAKHFLEFPEVVHQLIDALPEEIHEDFLRDVDIPDKWMEGPVVLIGDAVHAMTPGMGQGANMGLEDVAELVRAIVHERPLSEYVQARQPRVAEIQKQSRLNTIQSNTFTKETASIPFQRRKYSEDFKARLYNWEPPAATR